jgi:mRNA interferase RelE/StbE
MISDAGVPRQIWLYCGQMRFEIVLAPQAASDLRALPANRHAAVRDALEVHLRHEPERRSKSRIKRLRGLIRPQYRLRVDDIRVFYDIIGQEVHVLAIVPKSLAQSWLEQEGATGA